MADLPVGPVLKRKRISVACNSCRAKKAKCDGHRPTCGRCAGYDFECTWGDQRQSLSNGPSQRSPSPSAHSSQQERPSEVFVKHEQLVLKLCSNIPENEQEELKTSLVSLKTSIFSALSTGKGASPTISSESSLLTTQRLETQKFVGEISDIHFLNLVTHLADPDGRPNGLEGPVNSYDPDEATISYHVGDPAVDIPRKEEVERNLKTYFATIHLAYPFVHKTVFMQKVERLHKEGPSPDLTHSWFSLLYALLAIGSYYNSFSPDNPSSSSTHRRLFERSFLLAGYDALERSPNRVSALLAQCFYMLATSQIDRSWASLGIAIRLGQSIGLHANTENAQSNANGPSRETEYPGARSRIWYCLYVLDRLLALQLGRPPAIADEDCHVALPGRMEDLEVDYHKGATAQGKRDGPDASEYFTRMVEFSSIIGKVLRKTYHPRKDMTVMLANTKHCDQLLLQWKDRLPRFLRFDLGQVFDKSVVFKRQRNMLAIKFHHLRTLIHRPYLCFPCLRGHSTETLQPHHYIEGQQYNNICIAESQAIARLMHNLTDTGDVVMNYPWWQMISCLVCAASVMILAECFNKQKCTDDKTLSLDDDVDVCMEVLSALANDSTGAKLALDMLKTLQARSTQISEKLCPRAVWDRVQPETSRQIQTDSSPPSQDSFSDGNPMNSNLPVATFEDNMNPTALPYGEANANFGPAGVDDTLMWSTVMPDSMNWPLEFLNMIEDPPSSSNFYPSS
ncbi:fungal-specific transcription factor domain-containing protein [Pestalotiopsis sp. NC0098]|nr:fungal-specific transcription factor domain-containing protein [Pestalotiopsis sp. NC0098]